MIIRMISEVVMVIGVIAGNDEIDDWRIIVELKMSNLGHFDKLWHTFATPHSIRNYLTPKKKDLMTNLPKGSPDIKKDSKKGHFVHPT